MALALPFACSGATDDSTTQEPEAGRPSFGGGGNGAGGSGQEGGGAPPVGGTGGRSGGGIGDGGVAGEGAGAPAESGGEAGGSVGGSSSGEGGGGEGGARLDLLGGSCGAPGEGGADTGGTSSVGSALPSCLRELLRSCPVKVICETEDGPCCSADGSERVRTEGPDCFNNEERVYRADGSLCYSITTVAHPSMACENPVSTYRDGDGQVVGYASETISGMGANRTYSCAGTDERSLCRGVGTPTCEGPEWSDGPLIERSPGDCEEPASERP